MEFYLDTSIKELRELGVISTRTYNCLHHNKMETLGNIIDNIEKPSDLMHLRNFGRKSFTEIEKILNVMIRKKVDVSIKELFKLGAISVRTYNCLHYNGMETLGNIVDNIKKPSDLMHLRNFGRKSFTEIEKILNVTIRKKVDVNPYTKNEDFSVLGERLMGIVTEAYTKTTEGETRVKAYLRAAYPQPHNLHFLVMGKLNDMLEVVDGYTLNENIEMRYLYINFIELVLENLIKSEQTTENKIYLEYQKKKNDFLKKIEFFSYEQIAKHFLSPIASELLEKKYHEQVASSLSVRSKNFVAKYLPHLSDFVKYAQEPLTSYRSICPGHSMKKTLMEVFHFNQKFCREFKKVSELTEDEIQIEFLKFDYPFLFDQQHQFVFRFMKENNHLPLFFLMFHYLRLSENRSNKLYCLQHGIFDGKKRTLYEIADTMNLSRERVRQIVSGTIEVQKSSLVKNDGWNNYEELFELPFIYEKSEEYVRVKEVEHLPDDFGVFAPLVNLVADFKMEYIEGHTILVNNKHRELELSDCLNTFFEIIDAKYSVDTFVTIDSILPTMPEPLKSQTKMLIKYVAKDIYKIYTTEDDRLYMPQNYTDIAAELYDILANKGEPMHIEEIFKEFKIRYPKHKYTKPFQIKSCLYKHEHIKAVGKTSCYALDFWKGVFFGSIRDLLADLLSASDSPLHIDNLYDGVIKHYPNTTKASLAATMENENFQRFVEFEGGYFGLTSKNYSNEYVVAASVQRYRFEDRLQMFKDFVDTYHRFPEYNGSAQESSLMRWHYNATTGVLSITEEQKKKLDDTLRHYDELGYPRSATENDFLIKCQDIKNYLRQNHTLPTKSNAPKLYAWLRRSRDNYDSFTDKRRQYMTDLLNYIMSFGFNL